MRRPDSPRKPNSDYYQSRKVESRLRALLKGLERLEQQAKQPAEDPRG